MPDDLLRIGELSRRSGVSVDSIRAWERRYALLRPSRTDGGYRLYSSDDVSRLALMLHYLGRGLPAAQAAGLVQRVQVAAFDADLTLPAGDARKALRVLQASLEEFDDGPAVRMLERLGGVFATGAILRDVVLPFARGLGQRWERGEVTIAQEHFATSFLEGWMLAMARGWGRSGRYRAVLACLPGERHTLGLLAFGLALRELDWRVTYLGADTPLRAAESAAEAVAADVMVLTGALPAAIHASSTELEHLMRRRAVAIGGAGARAARVDWLLPRTLPEDPLVAAHALTAHEEAAAVKATAGAQPSRERRRYTRVEAS